MSNQTKHTPGPWRVEYNSILSTWETGEEVQLCSMAHTHWSSNSDGGRNERIRNESEANARLIAAAPELLEACKAGLESLVSLWRSEFETRSERYPENRDPAVVQMKSAIAKATGTVTP